MIERSRWRVAKREKLLQSAGAIVAYALKHDYRQPQRPADDALARIDKVAQEIAAALADPGSAAAQQVRGASGFI